ncbi:putative tRNA nucleotidyltransferase poly(A) polymerase family protein, partial [Teratosphaeria destructans]
VLRRNLNLDKEQQELYRSIKSNDIQIESQIPCWMLPLRQRLSQQLFPGVQSHCQRSTYNAATRLAGCVWAQSMSPARVYSTSPEGNKRRRLSTSSSTRLHPQANMAPALIQEVHEASAPETKLELTPVEDTLKRLLLDVAKHIDDNSIESESRVKLPDHVKDEPIVLRFTGGWVRDKLLGVPSHDIDVAINKMTGYQFGLRLKEYLEISGNPATYGLEGVATTDKQSQKAGATDKSKTVGGLHKIEANPEKSKHLETVTTRILGLDIDLVNLRKETYTDDSRNPQMEFGTPEEDALRRDATINAMFYNINTGQVEDFTGRGHHDLRDRIIRTPLESYQTFQDDPLRILRLIRFSSRLGYSIDSAALDAMKDSGIKASLRRKISRERVGVELDKALRGPDPHEALRLIFSLDLYETIFSDPSVETVDHFRPDTENWQLVIDTVRDIIDDGRTLAELLIRDGEETFLAYQVSALIPYRDAPQPEPVAPGKKAPPPVAVNVAKEGIKSPNKVADVILAAVRNQEEISNMVDKMNNRKRQADTPIEGDDPAARDVLGMAIRRWGPSWRSQMLYAFLVDLANNPGSASAVERNYTSFVLHLRELKILEAYTLKPLLDGKALAKALSTPPGPWMKDALDVVMAWQLRNPDSASAEEAIEEVRQKRGELPYALVRHFLKLTIRPLFSKTKLQTVTKAGRKVTGEILPVKITPESQDDEVNKPWKSAHQAYALDLLKWVINALDEETLEKVWHLVVPPVLSLLDDWQTKYKTLGASFLQHLLKVTPPLLLERTGLGSVFEEALLPCLTYLPSLTPEPESLALLSQTYPALLTLAHIRCPSTPPQPLKTPAPELERQRTKLLDSVIRKGILSSYTHAQEFPAVTALLFHQLVPLLDVLGVASVKHLQYVLPVLTEVLAHPLGSAQRGTQVAAARGLRAVVLNGWPRIGGYRGEVLRGVAVCWVRLGEGEGEGELREELKVVVQVLRCVVCASEEGRREWEGDVEKLVQADGRLSGVFS